MTFTHCSIVGLGLLGGSLAIDLRETFPQMTITGIARRQETLDEAAAVQTGGGVPVFTRLSLDLADAHDADLIVLCTPIRTEVQQLAELAPVVQPGALITDVGSTKRMIMNAATMLPEGVFFVGGHPMAGSDRAGLAYARAGLYRGATWALCAPEGAEEAAARLAALVEAIGARPLPIDAEVHDGIVALTSHLPHIVACALAAQVLADQREEMVRTFIAGGFRDTTRIAAANTAMWRDICLTNRDNIVRELNTILDALAQWRDALRNNDAPHLEALLTRAHTLREELNN